jgi:O-antigen/teichoic acid export membrane protein
VTTATDKEKKAVRVYVAAAVLNLVTNIIAIPIWGYVGAAVSTVLTEVVALLLFYAVLHREFPLADWGNTLVKPLLAGLVMAGGILVLKSAPLLLVITIGGLVYGLTLLLLKPFSPVELDLALGLWSSLRRKMGWGVSR